MAKKIAFSYETEVITWEMQKIDRSRLYGTRENEVVDESGNRCELATLAGDGKSLIGKGGTGIGYLTADGQWADKSKLTPVDLEGQPITPVPSSFAAPIELTHEVEIDEFLNHNIRLIYNLDSGTNLPAALDERLKAGAIFRFDYSFRGGLVADSGFLLMNESGNVFFLVGDRTTVDFIGLPESAAVSDGDLDVADDLLDFDMI